MEQEINTKTFRAQRAYPLLLQKSLRPLLIPIDWLNGGGPMDFQILLRSLNLRMVEFGIS